MLDSIGRIFFSDNDTCGRNLQCTYAIIRMRNSKTLYNTTAEEDIQFLEEMLWLWNEKNCRCGRKFSSNILSFSISWRTSFHCCSNNYGTSTLYCFDVCSYDLPLAASRFMQVLKSDLSCDQVLAFKCFKPFCSCVDLIVFSMRL